MYYARLFDLFWIQVSNYKLRKKLSSKMSVRDYETNLEIRLSRFQVFPAAWDPFLSSPFLVILR